jgi:pimeloyl-ACP methyl ester carboxylesterase
MSPFSALDLLAIQGLAFRGFDARHVETPHGPVYVLDARGRGRAGTVVVLHGLGSAAADSAPLLLRLLPHFRRVLALDLPGHGRSLVPDQVDLRGSAEGAVIEALDTLLDSPALVVGNSLGGLVAARFALARPQHVAGLLLLSPAGAPLDQAQFATLLHPFRQPELATCHSFLERALGGPHPFTALLAPAFRHRARQPGLRSLVTAMDHSDLLTADDVARLPTRTLVAWGTQEQVLPLANRDFYARHLPAGATVEAPSGWCHASVLRQPAAVARLLLRFASNS